eukprot:12489464-Alexandrium_andersonii.AAC.1
MSCMFNFRFRRRPADSIGLATVLGVRVIEYLPAQEQPRTPARNECATKDTEDHCNQHESPTSSFQQDLAAPCAPIRRGGCRPRRPQHTSSARVGGDC